MEICVIVTHYCEKNAQNCDLQGNASCGLAFAPWLKCVGHMWNVNRECMESLFRAYKETRTSKIKICFGLLDKIPQKLPIWI